MGQETFMNADTSTDEITWALIDFAAWCFQSKGNLASTISGKFAAVQYFHRTEMQVEIATTSPLIKCALRGIARSHTDQGIRHRVRLPVTWKMLLEGERLIPEWGVGGRVLWLCLSLSYFLIARSDEIFASSSGQVHPAHCLTRKDVAFCSWRYSVGLHPLATGRYGGGKTLEAIRGIRLRRAM